MATAAQRFIAHDWPMKLWFGIVPIVTAAYAVAWCRPAALVASRPLYIFGLLGILLLCLAGGFFLAAMFGWFVIGPVYFAAGRRNGAPFTTGDTVRIIAGRHAGTVGTIYSMWQGDSFRVRLGSEPKAAYGDIFLPYQVLRVSAAELAVAPEPAPPAR